MEKQKGMTNQEKLGPTPNYKKKMALLPKEGLVEFKKFKITTRNSNDDGIYELFVEENNDDKCFIDLKRDNESVPFMIHMNEIKSIMDIAKKIFK